MQSKFMISYKDRKLGPLTESQIRKMLAGKQIQPTDYFFDDEKQDWVPLLERFSDTVPASVSTPAPVAQAAVPAPAQKSKAPPPPHKKQSLDFPRNPKPEMLNPTVADFEVLESTPEEAHTQVLAPTPTTGPTPPAPVAKAEPPAPVKAKIIEKNPAVAPKPSAPPAAIQSKANHSSQSESKVQLSGGVGTISLKQIKAGAVSLKLKSDSGMELPMDLSLMIQSAPASQIKWETSNDCRAGEEITVQLTAYDPYDNTAGDFNGHFEVVLSGKEKETATAQFEDGLATVVFKPTCAETVSMHIKESNKFKLSLPEAVEITVRPNVPVKLVAEAPKEVRAGEDIALKITALDAYGNVVSDFKGEIDLKVEAQPAKKAG